MCVHVFLMCAYSIDLQMLACLQQISTNIFRLKIFLGVFFVQSQVHPRCIPPNLCLGAISEHDTHIHTHTRTCTYLLSPVVGGFGGDGFAHRGTMPRDLLIAAATAHKLKVGQPLIRTAPCARLVAQIFQISTRKSVSFCSRE